MKREKERQPKPFLWEDDGQYLSGWGLLAVFFGLFAFCCGLIFFSLHEKAKAPETVKNCFLICIQNNGAYCETYQPVCTEIKHVDRLKYGNEGKSRGAPVAPCPAARGVPEVP